MNPQGLMEWAPLTDLHEKIPLKVGLLKNLNLTCISVVSEFIALGTDCGLLLWYNRKKREMQKLRLEYSLSVATCIQVVDSVDWMVAAGDESGRVTIFQIEKEHPVELAPIAPKPKPIERFTITGCRLSPVTCVQWSKNGMKLFSGDRAGKVILTEINYQTHSTRSREIINESYEIIQLSFLHPNSLLVSTCYRTIVCHKSATDESWQVAQVGRKDRKALCRLGAAFIGPKHDERIIAARPGYRLWVADVNGEVKKTLVFKEAMNGRHPLVPLLNPAKQPVCWISINFGLMYPYDDDRVLTSSENVIYLLNLRELVVEQVVQHLRGILDVSVDNGEIFILETNRSVIRIAAQSEREWTDRKVEIHTPLWQNEVQDSIDEIDSASIADEELPPILPFQADLLNIKLEEAQRRLNEQSFTFNGLDPKVLNDPIVFKSEGGPKSMKHKSLNRNRAKISTTGSEAPLRKLSTSSSTTSSRKSSDIDPPNSNDNNTVDFITRAALLDISLYDELPKPAPSKDELEQKERELASILNIEPIILEPIEPQSKPTPKRDFLLTISYPLPQASIVDSPRQRTNSPHRLNKTAPNGSEFGVGVGVENLTDDMKKVMIRSVDVGQNIGKQSTLGAVGMSKSMYDLPSPGEILNIADYIRDIPNLWNKMERVSESDEERQVDVDGDISTDWEIV